MNKTRLICGAAFSALVSACAGQGMRAAAPATVQDGVLTGAAGMALYTFDKGELARVATAVYDPLEAPR